MHYGLCENNEWIKLLRRHLQNKNQKAKKHQTAKLKSMKTQKRPSLISSHLNRTNLVNKGVLNDRKEDFLLRNHSGN